MTEGDKGVRDACSEFARTSESYKGRRKHINIFNIIFLAPTQNPHFGPPRQKSTCLISWERMQKGDPHKFFLGYFWGQKQGPKRTIFGHKSLVYFFSCPYLSGPVIRDAARLPSVPKLLHGSRLFLTIIFGRRNVKITSQKSSWNHFWAP